ncbi:MAG TPA: ABC transporter permease [Solirubrobacteraceae bacterium]|nr:ABC transporter permease [Solirubrobacteraceae bacterium]
MRWLILKDLRILRRSPLLCGLLVLYPVVVALMIGAAFAGPPARPAVAFVDEVPRGQGTIAIGRQRLDVADDARGLLRSVHAIHVPTREAAIADVRSGRALAAVVIPADLPRQIESLITQGVGSPTVHLYLNTRDPLERRYVEDALQARIAAVQSEVSRRVLRVAVADLQRVLAGGRVSLLGHSVSLLGLRNTRAIVEGTIASLPRRSPLRIALRQVSAFATEAIDGLGFARPVLGSIGSPLTVTQTELQGATTPTSVYAGAIAAVVSLMFLALLLAAGTLALEWSEGTYARLVRGLVKPSGLLAAKAVQAGACAAAVTLALAASVSAFVHLDWARFGLWALAFACGGLAFATLGTALGAIAREVATASLMAFLASLPIAFCALVPASAVSPGVHALLSIVDFCFPFAPALAAAASAFRGAGAVPVLTCVHLLAQAAVFGAVARFALARRGAGGAGGPGRDATRSGVTRRGPA